MSGPSSADVVVALHGVHKSFGSKHVLRGVDLAVREGETFTILGGSGSGKSVCLKLMIGLLKADAGRVELLGEEVTGASEAMLVTARKNASMIFQSGALFDSLDVFENVAYPLREHCGWDEARIAERVGACLESVGLPGVRSLMPAELSGGMRKRVALARGIALEPRIILYDEPTTGLDPANQQRIAQLIRSLQRSHGITSLVVTHELGLCFEISDRVALLKRGRIAAMGGSEEIRRSDQPDVVAFLAGQQDPEDEAGGGDREDSGDGA